MTLLTHDRAPSRLVTGVAFALVSAASFGLSGSLGKALQDAGWSAGGATLVRVSVAAAVLLVPGLVALRGRWDLLRRGAATIIAYGVFAVAGAQLFYFIAVGYLNVGVALLIEYMAPVVVVLWMWLRHGHRPTRLTVAGGGIALAGLALLLDVFGGGRVSLVGIAWALAAMVGASVYFVISGDESNGLPPLTLAAGGLVVAVVVLGGAAAAGVLPIVTSAAPVVFVGFEVPWWAAVALLGVVTAAIAYTTGIAATRRLGARLGSFVALSEVVAATMFAWLLLGQAPLPVQFAGAALVLAGVIVVKIGEPRGEAAVQLTVEPLPPAAEPDASQEPVAA